MAWEKSCAIFISKALAFDRANVFLGSVLKPSYYTIGNRNLDLPTCVRLSTRLFIVQAINNIPCRLMEGRGYSYSLFVRRES